MEDKPLGFRTVFIGTVMRPWSALKKLELDPDGPKKGAALLLFVVLVYSLIVGIFLIKGHSAMEPSVLPIPVEKHYAYQIWYQGPLFFLDTLAAAGFLTIGARLSGRRTGYGAAFARLCFASATPMVFTVMLVELALSLLILTETVGRQAILNWFSGRGAWFMISYQAIGVAWIAALFLIVGIQTAKKKGLGLILGAATLAVYALPIALVIR